MTPEEALGRAALAGIHCLSIATPFPIGPVNVYLIEDEPLTLVDAGPNSGAALQELSKQLGRRGYALEDLGLILITHQHFDHIGLARVIAERSGAEIVALGAASHRLGNLNEAAAAEDEYVATALIRHGVPEEVAVALQAAAAISWGYGSSFDLTRPLLQGDTIRLAGRTLEVLHRPGHSPSDTVFWDAEGGFLFAGDHLLADVSSNPLISMPLDGSSRRVQSLVTYIESLRLTRALPAEIILGGHGGPIVDHQALIDARSSETAQRKEKIFRLVREANRTGYDLAREIWGGAAVTQTYPALSEVIGHTDILVNEGRIIEGETGGSIRFQAT
jgi:glyoxylase-like metal-dependent hydrolase (beta-lactamase superfamily II)